ncbi:MAG: hypothetical protein AB1941_24010 [Gemmatimonadota bacterium]
MRIARTAATLVLVLAAASCGTHPTEPARERGPRLEPARAELVSPGPAVPLKSGNTIGSGS